MGKYDTIYRDRDKTIRFFAIAVHEAGHAIIGAKLGYRIKKIHLSTHATSRVHYDREPCSYRRQMCACAAGPVAEAIFLDRDEIDFKLHTGDLNKMLDIRRRSGLPKRNDDRAIQVTCQKVRKYLEQPAVIQSVYDLAQRLVDAGGEIVYERERPKRSRGFRRLQKMATAMWNDGADYP